MASPSKVPPIPRALLEELESRYPDRIPVGPGVTLDVLRILQGQQDVVRFLRYHFDQQNKTVLESK